MNASQRPKPRRSTRAGSRLSTSSPRMPSSAPAIFAWCFRSTRPQASSTSSSPPGKACATGGPVFAKWKRKAGGKASFRFPKGGFYAIVKVLKLEPEHCVEWECTDSKHPENSGFIDLHDWIGTRLRFEIDAIGGGRSRLTFTHVGLSPLECFGACSSIWSFYLNQSLRGYLESGVGQPSVT